MAAKKTTKAVKAKKSTAKKAVAKKKVAKKKSVTKKVAAKKKAVKKVVKKKVVTKKTVAKKKVAKKVVKKKAVTKKVAAKKKTTKKVAVKKVVAKKAAAKKGAAKKVATKKPVAKKPVKKEVAKKASDKKTTTKSARSTSKKTGAKKTVTNTTTATKTAKRRSVVNAAAGPLGFTPYVETKGEEYMNQQQVEHFSNILLLWKHQLMEEVDSTVGHMKEDDNVYADPVDRASMEADFNLELRTRDRERKLIRKIESALDDLDRAEYGYCEDCGADIGIRRLEARPTATKCIDCKTFQEIKEKQGA